MTEERTWAEKFILGDEEAFAWAARTYGGKLYAAVRRLADTHEDADDIVQETFLRAWERRRDLKEPDALFAWLRRIAVSVALNALRGKKRAHLVALDDAPPLAAAEGGETPMDASHVRALVERLPPRQREALLLRLEEVPYDDIAAAMGCTAGAAKAHVHQAVGNLRKMMGERL